MLVVSSQLIGAFSKIEWQAEFVAVVRSIHKTEQCWYNLVMWLLYALKVKIDTGDLKVSVHLMITIQKVTSNVQSIPRQSPDIY